MGSQTLWYLCAAGVVLSFVYSADGETGGKEIPGMS